MSGAPAFKTVRQGQAPRGQWNRASADRRCCAWLHSCSAVLLLLAGFANDAAAQLPVTRLFSIFPAGGRSGAEVDVRVTGRDFDGPLQLQIHPGEFAITNSGIDGVGFRIQIPANASPGRYEARLLGRHGLSNPRPFVVGWLEETLDASTNQTASSAQALAVNTAVHGRTTENAADHFRFSVPAGRRVLIECLAPELDSRAEPVLTLLDDAGAELGRAAGSEAFVVQAPTSGECVRIVKLHDVIYRGGDEYPYRLSIRDGPRIEAIHPPSGQAGTTGTFTIYGYDLPGGTAAGGARHRGLQALECQIPIPAATADLGIFELTAPPPLASTDAFGYRLQLEQRAGRPIYSNPVWIGIAQTPVVAGARIVEDGTHPLILDPPCEWVGPMPAKGRAAWAQFEAKKGERWWIEIISNRLGQPTDPVLIVHRVRSESQGAEALQDVKEIDDSEADFGGVEFRTHSRDGAWLFEVPDTGVYRLQVRDRFAPWHADLRRTFRVLLRRPQPDFRLAAVALAPPPANRDQRISTPWSLVARRGETIPIRALVYRREGFDGPIRLSIEGLGEGLDAAGWSIEAGKNSGWLLITAATNAPAWIGRIVVRGSAQVDGRTIERVGLSGTVAWHVEDYNNDPVHSRLAGDLALSVAALEEAPIRIEAQSELPIAAASGAKVAIPIVVHRDPESKAKLSLKPVGIAALEKVKDLVIEGTNNQAVLELDLSEHKLAAGEHQFSLNGQATGRFHPAVPELAQAKEELKAIEEELKRASGLESPAAARKELEEKKKAAEAKLKELDQKAQPRDVHLNIYSAPIRLKIMEEAKP